MMEMEQPDTPETIETDPNCYLLARHVRRLCGGVSDDTLRRWRRRAELNFPIPKVINGKYFWKRSAIEQWLEDREEGA